MKMHPDSRCEAATSIEVDVLRLQPRALSLLFRMTCNVTGLRVPTATITARSDGLWRHTCFEVFLRGPQGLAYYELNFSPSTQWAAYRFNDYRSGMSIAHEIGASDIKVHANEECFELQTSVVLNNQPAILPSGEPWHLGLSAVVEERSGRLSYWALRHPPGKPDFHHSDCFAHELAATLQS